MKTRAKQPTFREFLTDDEIECLATGWNLSSDRAYMTRKRDIRREEEKDKRYQAAVKAGLLVECPYNVFSLGFSRVYHPPVGGPRDYDPCRRKA